MSKSKHITGNFNISLYFAIRNARKKVGLNVACLNIKQENHNLIGKKLYSCGAKKEYTVISVSKHWYNGWYEVLLLEDDKKSSRHLIWKNINCKEESILKSIDENRVDFYSVNKGGRYIKSFY